MSISFSPHTYIQSLFHDLTAYENFIQLINAHIISSNMQSLFQGLLTAYENGGKAERIATTLGYTKDQVEAIQRLKNSRDNYERLGLTRTATK